MSPASEFLNTPFRLIDISQPIQTQTACFPGDVPFSKEITVSYETSNIINLTAFTMSPHVGTHIDAPVHVRGSMTNLESNSVQTANQDLESAGSLPLSPFAGACFVVDISPCTGAISPSHLADKVPAGTTRILLRTRHQIRFDHFEDDYAYFSVELIDWFQTNNIVLAGLDTPSVDKTDSKSLCAHHRLLEHRIFWLENLDLSQAEPGNYFLVAMPLKFMELEASPVRAVLIDWSKT